MTTSVNSNNQEDNIKKWLSYIYENMSNNSVTVLFKRRGDNDLLAKSKIYQLGLPYKETPYMLTAYIGFYQNGSGELSFGEACRKLANNMGNGESISKSIENHFVSILKEDDLDNVADHFYKLLNLINKKSLKIDLHKFLRDVMYIGNGKQYTQIRWAKEFWSPVEKSEKS
jgi:hypothetical protein